ncbi:hypothetical protein MTYP_03029 [Methylophilaceae bacterium]|nr:hypothetical protein MTYP_03029 [Methylophilaceae bacterium]
MPNLLSHCFIAAILCLVPWTASAGDYSFTIGKFNETKHSEPTNRYINGLGQGYAWMNGLLDAENKERVYCPPAKVILFTSNYIQLIEDELKAPLGGKPYSLTSPIDPVLLIALRRTFPCEKKAK